MEKPHKLIWVCLQTSHASGLGQPDYQEIVVENDWTPEQAAEEARLSYEQEYGDGIRKSRVEIIPYPPAEWMEAELKAIPARLREIEELSARLATLVQQAARDLPWSVGQNWDQKLLKRFATHDEAVEWLSNPKNYRVNKERLAAGEYWLVGPSEDEA